MTAPVNLAAHLLDIYDFLPLSNRNYFVDGNFDSWIGSGVAVGAGGTTFSAATMYHEGPGAGGACTINQQGFALGNDPGGLTSPNLYYLQHIQSTASTGTVAARTAPLIFQNIEEVRTLAGRSATFSCWLWVASGSITIPAILTGQGFGSGGSPSGAVYFDKTVNWVVTTTPQRFSVRMDIPSILGKTLGSTPNTSVLSMGLWLPPGVTFTLNTTQWQLEQSSPQSSSDINGAGGLPTAFEYRGQQAELARVQRYYAFMSYSGASINGFAVGGGTTAYGFGQQPPVPMRVTPTASLVGTWTYTAPAGNSGTVSCVGVTPNNWYMVANSGSYTAGQAGYFGCTTGGGVILDARL